MIVGNVYLDSRKRFGRFSLWSGAFPIIPYPIKGKGQRPLTLTEGRRPKSHTRRRRPNMPAGISVVPYRHLAPAAQERRDGAQWHSGRPDQDFQEGAQDSAKRHIRGGSWGKDRADKGAQYPIVPGDKRQLQRQPEESEPAPALVARTVGDRPTDLASLASALRDASTARIAALGGTEPDYE